MKAIIEVNLDGAAFDKLAGRELARTLFELITDVQHSDRRRLESRYRDGSKLFDSNGNACGSFKVTRR